MSQYSGPSLQATSSGTEERSHGGSRTGIAFIKRVFSNGVEWSGRVVLFSRELQERKKHREQSRQHHQMLVQCDSCLHRSIAGFPRLCEIPSSFYCSSLRHGTRKAPG